MSGERSSRGKGPARPNFSWEEFELAQRPTKWLLTPGTRHYDEPMEWVGMGWNLAECTWNVLEWPLEFGGMNLESVGMEFHLDSIRI